MLKQGSLIIGVIGGEQASVRALAQAEAVGAELARRGCTLICGGRGGVMEAACRGARSAGGLTIGVLPGTDRAEMNPYVDLPIVSGVGRARNLIIVLSADAVIAIDGGYGTLSEIGYALQYAKPLVGLSTWSLTQAGVEGIPMLLSEDPVEAVALAMAAAAARDEQTALEEEGNHA
jgi:uncharacterized protein (TIGR00725 family)